ncbi:histidinol-phosphate transaminase [Candidatus Woesearchaeota archaeon]|jgi:histidinol-phosphate aminotransferase|nr:histidinol-phosphate transaminase [Candidatus Woesearchaeota archaeon]
MIKPRKAVLELEEYKPPISDRNEYLRLDFNENTRGCSSLVSRKIRSISKRSLATYPDYKELRTKLSEYCKANESEIITTNGADEAIKTIFETYIERNQDETIIPVPTYALFKFYAQLSEAVIKEVEYNNDLSFPTKKILKSINRETKIIVLVNPNNPTGTSINRNDIIKIIKKAQKNSAFVIIDEAYYQYCRITSIPLIKKYDNLFVLQTFSKVFGLAGLRLGYICSNKGNIKYLQKVLSPYSVNRAAIEGVMAALQDKGFVKKYVSEVNCSKKTLYDALNLLGIGFFKSDANFVLIRIGNKADYFYQKLKDFCILVRNFSKVKLLRGCIRITIGTRSQMSEFIKALTCIIKEINPVLIFDIDGVLVDTSKSYRIAIKQTSEYFTNEQTGMAEIQKYKNKGGYNNDWDLTEAIITSKGKKITRKKIIQKFQSYYSKLAKCEKWLLDKRILKLLSARFNLAIVTGRPRNEALYVLRKNNVKKYFSAIIAMEDCLLQKPSPSGLEIIMEKYGKNEAYYFGDAIDDIKAANFAKIKAVGVLPPEDKSPKLMELMRKNRAKCIIKDINSVLEAIQ